MNPEPQKTPRGCNPLGFLIHPPRSQFVGGYAALYQQAGWFVPDSVAFEMKTRGGHIRKSTLLSFNVSPTESSMMNGLPEEFLIYTGMKFFAGNQKAQALLLTDILKWYECGKPSGGLFEVLRDHLSSFSDDAQVEATKINYMSRLGLKEYRSHWEKLAEKISNAKEIPCIVMYSALLGLPAFLDRVDNGESLYLVTHISKQPSVLALHGFRISKNMNGDWSVKAFDNHSNIIKDSPSNLTLVAHSKNKNTKPLDIKKIFDISELLPNISKEEYFVVVPDESKISKGNPLEVLIVPTPRKRKRDLLGAFSWRFNPEMLKPQTHSGWAMLYSLSVVPDAIKFELNGLKGSIKKDTLLGVPNLEFRDIFVYLTTKLLDEYPELQCKFLEVVGSLSIKVKNKELDPSSFMHQIKSEATKSLSVIDEDTTVRASKISTIYRIGPDLFLSRWKNLAEEVMSREEIPCLVAYAGITGFIPLISHLEDEHSMILLLPKKETADASGFLVKRQGDEILISHHELGKIFSLTNAKDHGVSLIDDMIKSGSTMRNFLEQLGSMNPPIEVMSVFLC